MKKEIIKEELINLSDSMTKELRVTEDFYEKVQEALKNNPDKLKNPKAVVKDLLEAINASNGHLTWQIYKLERIIREM